MKIGGCDMSASTRYLIATLLGCTLIAPLQLSATPKDAHGKHGRNAAAKQDENGDREEKWEHDPVVFSARDRDVIRGYYRGAQSNLPPGLAKRNGNLPPGLRKQLLRNGTL